MPFRNTPELKKSELECLHEYVSVMQPVAAALDKLQGEKAAYFGNILPTLHMLQTKLQAMQHNMLIHCEPLVVVLLEGLERRFDKELKLSGAASDKIITAISHPYFNLRWLKERCRELFIQACRQYELVLDSSEASQSYRYLTMWTISSIMLHHQCVMQQ